VYDVPPVATALMLPLHVLLQPLLFTTVVEIVIGTKSLPTTAEQEDEHPLVLVTVTVYVAAQRLLISLVVDPLLHKNVTVPTVFCWSAINEPIHVPHFAFAKTVILQPTFTGWVILTWHDEEHPLTLLTVTVNVPAPRPDIPEVVLPLLQR
jgi:hypothetical protein